MNNSILNRKLTRLVSVKYISYKNKLFAGEPQKDRK